MKALFRHQEDLHTALDRLIALDPRLAAVRDAAGPFLLREQAPGFEGLASIVVGQQLSVASAAAIRKRLVEAIRPFEPERFLRVRADRLARLGLSAAKIKALKAIARAIVAGHIDLEALATLPADEAHAQLVSLHGVGPWTADVYLLFCLRHADAWPAGDLGLQEGVKMGLALATRPTGREMTALAEAWRPVRGAAAHLWWAYHKAARDQAKRPNAPDVRTPLQEP